MPRRTIATVISALAVLSASACSQSDQDSPAPPPNSKPGAPTSGAGNPAPKVNNPKNLKAVTDACQLLTAPQLSQLGGGGAPEPEKSEYGESQCSWYNENFHVIVAVNTKVGGPAKIFEGAGSSDNFQPTQVTGYPAARVDAQSALCRVEVGVADDQSVELNYGLNGGTAPEMRDPCGYAEKIATEVLKNIPNA